MCKMLLLSMAVVFFCGCASSSNQAKPSRKPVFSNNQGNVNSSHRVVRSYPAGCKLLPNGYLVCLKD